MGNNCQKVYDSTDIDTDNNIKRPTPQELWTSYTREQCCHLEDMDIKPRLVNANIETKIPFKNGNMTRLTPSTPPADAVQNIDKEQKLNTLKKQLEDEGTELSKKLAPIIVGGAFRNETIDSEQKDTEQKVMKSAGDILVNFMADGAKRFENEAGRKMTYSEMRELWV